MDPTLPGSDHDPDCDFSDRYGNSAATEEVLAAIDAEVPDEVICLGDLAGYGAHPNEVIDLVGDLDIPTITGNYDVGVGSDRDDCGCAYTDAGERKRGQASLMWTRAVVDDDRKAYLRTLHLEVRREFPACECGSCMAVRGG